MREETEQEQAKGVRTGMRAFGVMGHPVGHTLSPLIHQRFGEMTGNDLAYAPYEVAPEALADAVRGAYALGIQGLNATVPHKSAVIAHLNSIDPLAEKIGAVNTLVREAGGYRGYNTDASGLRRALEKAGVALSGARVVVLGAGGAGRAVVFLCVTEGAAEVVVVNRSLEKAAALCAEVNEKTGENRARAASMVDFLREDADGGKFVAIQCTSVGLAPRTEEAITEEPSFFARLSFAVDIVYRPLETKFLRLAAAAGVSTLGGLSMLLWQAADAFSLWYPGVTVTEVMVDTVMRLLVEELTGGAE